jgi:hypothetical protein
MPTISTPVTIRCHHDDDEVRHGVAMDRLRLMATYARGYSVACDCCADEGLDLEDCGGLRVFNANRKPCATYRGRQYVALENSDRTIAIYSRLVRN